MSAVRDAPRGRPAALRAVLERRGARAALALPAFLAFGAFMVIRILGSPRSSWAGVAGDPPLFIWYLRWSPFAVTHGHDPLLTNYVVYPTGANLMWNTPIPLPALAAWPVTAVLGPIFSYNLLLGLAYALSGWCAYLAIRRHTSHHLAAMVGGLVYAGSPYMFGHGFGHLNLVLAVGPPLLLLLADELLVRQRMPVWSVGALLGALTAGQFLISEELLASEALVAALGCALLALLYRDQVRARIGYAAKGLAIGALTALPVVAFPLAVQFFGPQRLHGMIQPPNVFVSDLLGFVVPAGIQYFHPGWALAISNRFSGNGVEYTAYLGLPLLALLVLVAVRCWSRLIVRVAGLLLAAVAFLSLGPHLHVAGHSFHDVVLPWRLVQATPVLQNVLPSRLSVYVDLLAALLLAIFLDAALASPAWSRRLAGVGAAVLALVPFAPNAPLPRTKAAVPSFFTSGMVARDIPEGSDVLVAPFARGPFSSQPMAWQAEARMHYRMPSGYVIVPGVRGQPMFGPRPSPVSTAMETIETGLPAPPLNPMVRRQLDANLDRWRIHAVLVGPMPHQGAMLRFFTALLGRPPTPTGGIYLWTR